MRYLILLLCLHLNYSSSAQRKCGCEKDPMMAEFISCEEQMLRNGSKLYYQFNCDSIWLTLEFKNGRKKCLYRMNDMDLYGYIDRLGYKLIKEYHKYLLFRVGCPADYRDCMLDLVDKNTGKLIKEYDGLTYNLDSIVANLNLK